MGSALQAPWSTTIVSPRIAPTQEATAPLKLHEYQAREILIEAGVPMPPAILCRSAEEAEQAYLQLGTPLAVVKAQIHAGGRGKGGGVKLVRSAEQAREAAGVMFSRPLVTPQTGPAGEAVRSVLVAAGVQIEKEFYLGLVVDRARHAPVCMASAQGGVEIEQVARTDPDAILKETLHPHLGLRMHQARSLGVGLGLDGPQLAPAAELVAALAKVFLEKDCSLAEINPLVLTKAGEVLAIDAKITLDENALFRHPRLAALRDPDELDPAELRANKAGLSYVKLEGTIGCLVNGAGLAMATMDIIKLHGGEPANFLDVGGSVSREGAVEAFRIILEDEKVTGVLVNIFGGIAKCDTIAEALIAAAKEVGFEVPVVVRLEGTNVERARRLLAEASIPRLSSAEDLTDAARKVCGATG